MCIKRTNAHRMCVFTSVTFDKNEEMNTNKRWRKMQSFSLGRPQTKIKTNYASQKNVNLVVLSVKKYYERHFSKIFINLNTVYTHFTGAINESSE